MLCWVFQFIDGGSLPVGNLQSAGADIMPEVINFLCKDRTLLLLECYEIFP